MQNLEFKKSKFTDCRKQITNRKPNRTVIEHNIYVNDI